ncbi:MAG: TlpA family protein disulfide reductase [Bacteroidetes bacterium]|nr:TlpA family protein disulfide reductase [Bacteroidota bacterium]
MKIKNQKSFKKNLIEWGIIIGVIAFLYYTGLYSTVIGKFQQAALLTGWFQPEINIPIDQQQPADYNLSLISFDDKLVNLNEYKGKIIFLNFWASWCPPCRAEMPTIQKLYNEMKNRKDIAFILISVDSDNSKAIKFIKDEGFTFPVFYLNSGLPNIYNTGTIPSTFVISKEGKIVAKRIGMADYDSKKFYDFLDKL